MRLRRESLNLPALARLAAPSNGLARLPTAMAAIDSDGVTIVLPTYNRAPALQANLESTLALRDVAEVLVVNDGSSDDTLSVCASFSDSRLRIVSHPHNMGLPAARNTGIEHASGTWVLFGEDDCRFPINYAATLRAEAHRFDADIVGAPFVNVSGNESEIAEFVAAAPRLDGRSMDNPTSTFPVNTIETPFIPAPALVRRSVFDVVRFFDGFPVNGYREETDFFVQAVRSGFRSVLTPMTYCYQAGFWSGGAHNSSTLRYEYWAIRNNWRFLRRHEQWLVDQGHIKSAPGAEVDFALRRARMLVGGALKARIEGLRHARSHPSHDRDQAS